MQFKVEKYILEGTFCVLLMGCAFNKKNFKTTPL